jgi:hypothetical protein
VLLGVDGRSDFNGLHSRRHDHEVEFYTFDMLVSDGDDIRKLPLSMRKTNLARLLARRVDGIHLAPFEQGGDRPGSIPARLPDGAGGAGVEALREPIPRRSVRSLGQGQEPSSMRLFAG